MTTFFDSKAGIWTGRILSAVPGLLFLGSAGAKLSGATQAIEQCGNFGYPAGTLPDIGIVEVVCAILYLVPRTAVLGAVLLTAYLGGGRPRCRAARLLRTKSCRNGLRKSVGRMALFSSRRNTTTGRRPC